MYNLNDFTCHFYNGNILPDFHFFFLLPAYWNYNKHYVTIKNHTDRKLSRFTTTNIFKQCIFNDTNCYKNNMNVRYMLYGLKLVLEVVHFDFVLSCIAQYKTNFRVCRISFQNPIGFWLWKLHFFFQCLEKNLPCSCPNFVLIILQFLFIRMLIISLILSWADCSVEFAFVCTWFLWQHYQVWSIEVVRYFIYLINDFIKPNSPPSSKDYQHFYGNLFCFFFSSFRPPTSWINGK